MWDEPPVVEPLPETTESKSQQGPILVETVKSDDDDIESILIDQRYSMRKEDSSVRQEPSPQIPVPSPMPTPLSPSLSQQPTDFDNMYSGPSSSGDTGMKRRRLEPEMPDTTYEEQYGDAYIDAPIKYIYPSGYQSMRPRGGPWKLSIVICALFTWLSVFIVGHCSDRVDLSQYYAAEIDDDNLVMETRWCGSRLLYIMWVASMMITGLAAAYCSVIGYIKVRDFAVANGRSQPPGMVGQTDYYVRIADDANAGSVVGSVSSSSPYHTAIYQADGTPQFWGGHIYRPTQAAVAVTSR
jgi:hypothetical protein